MDAKASERIKTSCIQPLLAQTKQGKACSKVSIGHIHPIKTFEASNKQTWISLVRIGLNLSKFRKFFPPRESLVSDIQDGNDNVANLYLQCITSKESEPRFLEPLTLEFEVELDFDILTLPRWKLVYTLASDWFNSWRQTSISKISSSHPYWLRLVFATEYRSQTYLNCLLAAETYSMFRQLSFTTQQPVPVFFSFSCTYICTLVFLKKTPAKVVILRCLDLAYNSFHYVFVFSIKKTINKLCKMLNLNNLR